MIAVTARRTQANLIAAPGRTPQDIVIAGWRHRADGGDIRAMEGPQPRASRLASAMVTEGNVTQHLGRRMPDAGERRRVWAPTDDADFAERLKVVEDHRRRLTAVVGESLWQESGAVEPESVHDGA